MGNNNLKGTNDILVKVDQNNLIYIDPNSVLVNGQAQPRGVEPENLVMYVNLEADLIPRSILVAEGNTNSLISIAGGTLNFLQNKNGKDFDTTWTDAYVGTQPQTLTFGSKQMANTPLIPNFNQQQDNSAQSFGIESVSIQIAGANFIPRVVIKFIDVRGKTLFESPSNSPYGAFFHLPWPIFYLTVKGYYGKAIKYRLHMTKFSSRYNASNGNFEIETNYVGSTYAYLADISLVCVLNAPYFFMSEAEQQTTTNGNTKNTNVSVSKTTKGYRTLRSVYQEYINKGLLPSNFPVRTLRELIIMAGRLNHTLEKQIFSSIIDPKLLAGIKEFEDLLNQLNIQIQSWKNVNLSQVVFTDETTRTLNGITGPIRWFKLAGDNKNTLVKVTGADRLLTLENIISTSITKLEHNETFGNSRNNKLVKDNKLQITPISFSILKNIKHFYTQQTTVGIDMDGIEDAIYTITRNFVEQRVKLEADIEKLMNNIVKNTDKNLGIGFEPTVRNIIGVVLANAETYIRLMKDVHEKAFRQANRRKQILAGVLTDSDIPAQCIYPWPEVKLATAGNRQLVLMYPGSRELLGKLQSNDAVLWPEVDFVENFYEISTKKLDPLTGHEGDTENINYVFSTLPNQNKKDISVLTNVTNFIPYGDKSFSSILYEIYERAKYTTSLSPFSNDVMIELANVEYENLKNQVIDDIDLVEMLKRSIVDVPSLLSHMVALSTFERYPYYQDQLPTISYLVEGLSQDYRIEKFVRNTDKSTTDDSSYPQLAAFLKNYKPESYRKDIYPFNSSTYTGYTGFHIQDKNVSIDGFLTLNTPDDFIASPLNPYMWVKSDQTLALNLFQNTLAVNGVEKQILNTPYFHKQLYSDFTSAQSIEKYVGSAYLLLNSLPFKDLDDPMDFGYSGPVSTSDALVASIFKEVGATHYIPYHLMLKWGSIYHRYKKFITDNVDIIAGVTAPIDGNLFYSGNTGNLYNGIPRDIGFHPYYEDIFHQVVNGYGFFDPFIASNYSYMITTGVTHLYSGLTRDGNIWTSFVDNSRFDPTDKRYTLLPTNGYERINGSDFVKAEQDNFRVIWNIGTTFDPTDPIINYSGQTLPSYDEYFIDSLGEYSLSTNYQKVIDLIAVFKPDILDAFELAFLDFASEKLNEETSYFTYDFKYNKFQDLLKAIASASKQDTDPTDTDGLIKTLKSRQVKELENLTSQLLANTSVIRITLGNPREVDNYVLGGFTGVNVRTFSVNPFDPIQISGNNIQLYLGDDLDGYYLDFFSVNDVELSDENLLQFRPIIYLYAGLRAKGLNPTKQQFVDYLKANIISPLYIDPITLTPISRDSITGVGGLDTRLDRFLTQLIRRIQSSDFTIKTTAQTTTRQMGYNDDPAKLELYNYFKSFNDKWTAGNSIGQRTLMEEFLFLDKANRDIGSSVFIDMQKLTKLAEPGNEKINLFSAIALLVQDSGFDIRALPAYVNFYGTNFSNSTKITPSKNVAKNMFGTFLEVDYQESSPKIILQYIGPTSKHPELSDIDKAYKYRNDGFDIGNVHNNPIIVAPNVFTQTDFSKSNKVVAFEVSFGDQNQSIFKGVELDQATLKNTSESFVVLDRLGRNETGSSTSQIDIGLFDIYRQSSYQCQVTCMGDVMIQPTMYFYLKNIPLFRGSYFITEVTHNVKPGGIETMFKGTRIPAESLPNPQDSFLASYRSLFDKLVQHATAQVNADKNTAAATKTATEQVTTTPRGPVITDMGAVKPPSGEQRVDEVGTTDYGIPYNGDRGEKYIQLVDYNGERWLRAVVVQINGNKYKIDRSLDMSILSRNTVGKKVTYGDVRGIFNKGDYYFTKFNLDAVKAFTIMNNFTSTTFLNPINKATVELPTIINYGTDTYQGPVSIGPALDGFGMAMSASLMSKLGLYDGWVVYFKLQ